MKMSIIIGGGNAFDDNEYYIMMYNIKDGTPSRLPKCPSLVLGTASLMGQLVLPCCGKNGNEILSLHG